MPTAQTTHRPSWDLYFVRMAHLAATRSTCLRRRVGAVIVKDRMVLSTGYNDTPRGIRNCGDGGCARCAGEAPSGTAHDTCLCLHAEQNAVVQAAYHGVSIKDATIYVTYQPCLICAKILLNVGITRIVYEGAYPDPLALEMLREAGVEIVHYAGEEMPPEPAATESPAAAAPSARRSARRPGRSGSRR